MIREEKGFTHAQQQLQSCLLGVIQVFCRIAVAAAAEAVLEKELVDWYRAILRDEVDTIRKAGALDAPDNNMRRRWAVICRRQRGSN